MTNLTDKQLNTLMKKHNYQSKLQLKLQKEKDKEEKLYKKLLDDAISNNTPKPLF